MITNSMDKREIKFRAWDVDQKSMHEIAGFIQYMQFTEVHFGPSGFKIFPPEKVILLQYTGLQDKLKNEIYENDIVKITNYFNGIQKIGIVKMNDYAWCVECGLGNKVSYVPRINSSDIGQINRIGNIYENPDLLK